MFSTEQGSNKPMSFPRRNVTPAKAGAGIQILCYKILLECLILQRDLGIFGVHRPCYEYDKRGF